MTKKTTKKEDDKKITKKTLAKLFSNRRSEWRFELPLPAQVEGEFPRGQKFKEKTTVKHISSGGAYFCLDSGITVGSKLNLVIDLPSKLTEGKKVKLKLGGLTVRLNKLQKGDKKQGIALSFDEEYEFISDQESEE
jgi:hypothetical protein